MRSTTEETAVELQVPVLYPTQPRAVRLMNTIWADRTSVHDSLESKAHLLGEVVVTAAYEVLARS